MEKSKEISQNFRKRIVEPELRQTIACGEACGKPISLTQIIKFNSNATKYWRNVCKLLILKIWTDKSLPFSHDCGIKPVEIILAILTDLKQEKFGINEGEKSCMRSPSRNK